MSDRNSDQSNPKRWLIAALPLLVFLGLAGIFFKQLYQGGSSRILPSVLLGREAPKTDLPPLEGLKHAGKQVPGFNSDLFAGKLSIVNVWSSWCVPCRQEHPLLVELGKRDGVQIIGLNYKDKNENALRFLGQLGNPYDAVGVDQKGRGAIQWGVYGVPETYIVDKTGTIVYKQVGPLNHIIIKEKILPVLNK